MRTGNPLFREDTFDNAPAFVGSGVMTMEGTVNKTGLLLLLTVLGAGFTWFKAQTGGVESVMLLGMGGLVVGLILAIVTAFMPRNSMYTGPMYAVAEGLFLGFISAVVEQNFADKGLGGGIVMQAMLLTFAVLGAMAAMYRAGIIRVTDTFRTVVFAATAGLGLVYLANLLLWAIVGTSIPFIHESGFIGIGFSLFAVGLASLNLALDFDMIEQGVRSRAPDYMEWYGAFALLVTLVWLYIELLRLLAKLYDRR